MLLHFKAAFDVSYGRIILKRSSKNGMEKHGLN